MIVIGYNTPTDYIRNQEKKLITYKYNFLIFRGDSVSSVHTKNKLSVNMANRQRFPDGAIVMTSLELDGFLLFISRLTTNNDLTKFSEALSSNPLHLYVKLQKIKNAMDAETMLVDTILSKHTLSEIVATLYNSKYSYLAEILFCCYQQCQQKASIIRMNKTQTENRRKISLYFRDIKKLVHDIAFKNPHADVNRLSNIMKLNIEREINPVRKMYLCDKYTALKAAEMDALINITGRVSPDHEGYVEMESFINSTSAPSISQVILYGRKADVLSTDGRFTEGEDLLRAAYVAADNSLPCVEITDMIYKNVVFKLSQFEQFPTEELRKSLFLEASRGIWSLNDESEDMRIFWKRLFILRMAFCLLGIGKLCDMIDIYVPSTKSITEAERLLECDDLKDMEHRRMMFYHIAKSRLHQLKSDVNESKTCLQMARILAKEGNYAEDKALEKYQETIGCLQERSYSPECSSFDSVTETSQIVDDVPSVTISFNSLEFISD
ncbi:Hypothetical predicted protein [Mytilus galloprovincialis]|uniref:Uncharacterized protein n=2 Tax=Mytilus galloprovincialis TaxID=29158 RepID=A0A8B6C089_MYTGA|nr:Hypothetical predicted protein [Mytilus galloprovincialis]